MVSDSAKLIHYKRSRFSTSLPAGYRYSPSHAWLAPGAPGRWRVGLTRFATRMLGDMVDKGFESQPGDAVGHGQIIGWVEGFKAISDLYCVVQGRFVAGNPDLDKSIHWITRHPYDKGWLYEAEGTPDPKCLSVQEYIGLLDVAIDKILEQQKDEEPSPDGDDVG